MASYYISAVYKGKNLSDKMEDLVRTIVKKFGLKSDEKGRELGLEELCSLHQIEANVGFDLKKRKKNKDVVTLTFNEVRYEAIELVELGSILSDIEEIRITMEPSSYVDAYCYFYTKDKKKLKEMFNVDESDDGVGKFAQFICDKQFSKDEYDNRDAIIEKFDKMCDDGKIIKGRKKKGQTIAPNLFYTSNKKTILDEGVENPHQCYCYLDAEGDFDEIRRTVSASTQMRPDEFEPFEFEGLTDNNDEYSAKGFYIPDAENFYTADWLDDLENPGISMCIEEWSRNSIKIWGTSEWPSLNVEIRFPEINGKTLKSLAGKEYEFGITEIDLKPKVDYIKKLINENLKRGLSEKDSHKEILKTLREEAIEQFKTKKFKARTWERSVG